MSKQDSGVSEKRPDKHKTRLGPSAAVSLIINADDYGLHPAVDEAILHCHAEGVLSSASLMVNQPGWKAAAARAKDAGMALGLHVNFTLGRPLSEPAAVPGLLDAAGQFVPRATLLRRLFTGQARSAELRREFQAQCEAFLSAGCVMDHLDSHQHVHAHPRIFQPLAEYARDKDVPVRFLTPMPLLADATGHGLVKRAKQWLIRHQARRQCRQWTKFVRHNDFLVSVFDVMTGGLPEERHYSFIFESLQALAQSPVAECSSTGCVVEWMVHPVTDARSVAGLTRIGEVSRREYAILRSPEFRRELARAGVRLARYGQLPQPR